MFRDMEVITRKLGIADSHRIMRGEVTGCQPKGKRQKGFRGFHNEAPKFCTLSQEAVQIDSYSVIILDVYDVHSEDGVPTGKVRWRNKVRRVQKAWVRNPKVNPHVEFTGIGRVWRLV